MSDSFKLSQRAVAVSALTLVLGSASFAPAFADGGKDGKGDNGNAGGSKASGQRQDSGRKGSGSGSGGSGSAGSGGSSSSARGGDARQGGNGGGAGQGGAQRGQGASGGQGAQGGSEDPAGNNGTFKVDGLPFDDGMGNEPHVSCGFRLKFYGFDEGQTGDITIAGQAPSGSGVVSEKTGVLISDDAAGGGPNDPDAIVTYTLADLDLSGLTAHPKQGYHVKVTLETDTPGGVKHKVFWIEPCATTPPAVGGTGSETGGTDTGEENEVGGVDLGGVGGVGGVGAVGGVGGVGADTQDRAAVLGTKFTRDQAARGGTSVLGTALTRGPLAFTGSFAELLLALGGGLVAAGGGLVAFSRRPRGKHAL